MITVSDFIRDMVLEHGVAADRATSVINTMSVPALRSPSEREATRRAFGVPDGAPLIGIVARLDPSKGQADTLHAFVEVLKLAPEARLLIVGSEMSGNPGYTDELKSLSSSLGLDNRAVFLGRRDDVPRIMGALDVFVHPTRLDPCPLSVLEASAAGVPVVAYAEGGANEMVATGVTGLLTEPGNVTQLAQSLLHLVRNPAEARSMGASGRERVGKLFQPGDAGLAFTNLVTRVASEPVRR